MILTSSILLYGDVQRAKSNLSIEVRYCMLQIVLINSNGEGKLNLYHQSGYPFFDLK